MPPELFVRLRLLGFTTEAIEYLDKRYPAMRWEQYVPYLEEEPRPRAVAYWNQRVREAREHTNR
jgi:hypothetical protein